MKLLKYSLVLFLVSFASYTVGVCCEVYSTNPSAILSILSILWLIVISIFGAFGVLFRIMYVADSRQIILHFQGVVDSLQDEVNLKFKECDSKLELLTELIKVSNEQHVK